MTLPFMKLPQYFNFARAQLILNTRDKVNSIIRVKYPREDIFVSIQNLSPVLSDKMCPYMSDILWQAIVYPINTASYSNVNL